MRSLAGQQLGDYVLESEIGHGSMGVVYRATHARDGKPYAVKVLIDALTTDVSFITRFTREARVVAALQHPNIIRVFDAGRQGEFLYFAMEYFPAPTAGQMLKERKTLPVGQVIEIAAQAADGLAHAHAAGHLVHRDIKPDNLLVDRWCRVKVLDFGLARIEGLQSITRAGTVVGSLYYVSPEQLLGRKLDGRSDVYALGVSMYEMLCGKRPYRGSSMTEMSDLILGGQAVPVHLIEPGVPRELERIVARAMARDLEARYSSAADLHADLRALQKVMAASAAVAEPSHPSPSHPSPAPEVNSGQLVPPDAASLRRMTLRPATLQPFGGPNTPDDNGRAGA